MNYIEQIRRFWQCNNERPIGCNATALYFYLLNINNSLNWKDTFRHSDRYIAIQLGISVNTVRTAKNLLAKLGLLYFKAPQKKSRSLEGATLYSFTTVLTGDTVPDTDTDTDLNTVTNTVPDTDTDTRIKQNKTKQNYNNPPYIPQGENESDGSEVLNNPLKIQKGEKEKSSAKKEKEYNLSFVSSGEWQTLIREWLEYKAERKESYKSEKTVKAFATQLWNLSQRDITTAQAILQQSYACNYAGIFPLKNNHYANTTNTCNRKMPNLRQSDFD